MIECTFKEFQNVISLTSKSDTQYYKGEICICLEDAFNNVLGFIYIVKGKAEYFQSSYYFAWNEKRMSSGEKDDVGI